MIGDTAELAAPIAKLRDDLLSEVLLRLPNPKSACRCKPVCKRWRSLISTAYFTRRFLSTSTAAAADYDSDEEEDEEEGSLPDHEHLIGSNAVPKPILTFLPLLPDRIRDGIRVLDCFKDWLLCGFVEKFDTQSFCSSNCFLICNPFTKQWIALPLAPPRSVLAGLVSRLACQPCDDDLHFDEYRFRVVCIYEWGRILP
ncbi:unnamed protein product [Linum tenue]|uniref:F-box domain-containing protein n=1 Tax=Linum tenue TaxID=586396 RepID=A0AAV0RJJ1_9ROSI|nr:unnamed protein product [Linum tenue]